MITLDEYMQKNGDEIMVAYMSTIEDMGLPKEYEIRLLEIIQDNEYELIEARYEEDYSSYVNNQYDNHKEKGI